MNKKPILDETKLTSEQQDKLERYKQIEGQTQVLQDIALMTQEIISSFDDQFKNGKKDKDEFGAVLLDMRESLSRLSDKETPKMPDYAKPVVDAMSKLEKAFSTAIKAIDIKPEVKVDSPQVTVDVPSINTSAIEKIIKIDIPKAFEKAIKSMPKAEVPATNFDPLVKIWDGISEQLLSIENATRMKPLPGSMEVTTSGTVTEANSAAILTSTQLIDDTVATLGTATYLEGTTKANVIGAVRRDADTTLVDTTNEVAPLQVDANGRLKVEAFSGETLPVSLTSTTVTGTVAVTQSGTWDEIGINDSGNSITVDNSTLAVVGGGTEATAMRVTLANDSTGLVSVDDNGASLSVDWNGTQPVTGSGTATGALRVELPTNGTGVVGLNTGSNVIGALTANQTVNTAQINGVTTQMGVGASGTGTQRVVTATDSTIGTVTSVTAVALNSDIRQATASNLNAQVVGTVAHDGVDSGNPIKIGGKARQTNPTAVADLDRVDATFDDMGRQVVVLNQVRDLEIHQTTTITASTAETTILTAGAAGVFHDITLITIANTSATATRVDIRDATAGSVIWSMYVPAGQQIGANITVPIKQTTAANNWTATCITSLTDLRIFVQGVKNI